MILIYLFFAFRIQLKSAYLAELYGQMLQFWYNALLIIFLALDIDFYYYWFLLILLFKIISFFLIGNILL